MAALVRWSLPALAIIDGIVQVVSLPASWVVAVPAVALAAAALAVRKKYPAWCGACAVLFMVVLTTAGTLTPYTSGGTIGVTGLLLIYSVARHEALPASAWWIGGVLAISLVVDLSNWTLPFSADDGVFIAAAAGLGYLLRYRAGRAAATLQDALRAEREQIARDLHDVIAHGLSSIAVFAEGAAYAANPDSSEGMALVRIRDTAKATLDDTRRVIGLLRQPLEGTSTPPDLSRLSQLAAEGTLPVHLDVDGSIEQVPGHVSRALYRICQESLTNVRRHADGVTRVDLKLGVSSTEVHLVVHNDGKARPSNSPGYGLRGIGERVRLLGGESSAGPAQEGGWTVDVRVPVTETGGDA